MSVFRRRGKKAGDVTPETAAEGPAPGPAAGEPLATGPWDVDSLPSSGPSAALIRVDLGGLRVPAMPDVEVRVETDPTGAVVSVLMVRGPSTLQLGAFAAPRRVGIWDEVRAEILESLRDDGGDGQERDGPFGMELRATVPAPAGRQPARFVGVDGPRWFLRGVFTGPAATNPAQAAVLEQALGEVVVARGGDALPVRDPLPLTLPAEVLEEAGHSEPDRSAPEVPVRGPEITETR